MSLPAATWYLDIVQGLLLYVFLQDTSQTEFDNIQKDQSSSLSMAGAIRLSPDCIEVTNLGGATQTGALLLTRGEPKHGCL